jgi:restriction system protein
MPARKLVVSRAYLGVSAKCPCRSLSRLVGHALRYIGHLREEPAGEDQAYTVSSSPLEDDQRIRQALAMVPNIVFYQCQISFELVRA